MANVQSRILLDNYEKKINDTFNSTASINKISRYISRYIDRYSEQLYHLAPTKAMQFNLSGEDGKIIMDSIGANRREMRRLTVGISSIKPMSDVLKEPVSVGIALLLREATIRGNKKLQDQLMMYLVFSFYWSLQYRQFKFEPNESLVRYTINNLSNKFLFKTEDNVFQALYVTAETNHGTSQPSLVSEDDKDIMTYVMNIRTRLSSLLVRFTREVMKNGESKKYLNTVQDDTSEENYYEVQNLSGNIEKVAMNTMTKFSQGTVDGRIIRIASKFGDVPQSRLRDVLIGINNDEPSKTDQIIRGVIIDYLKDGRNAPDTIGSKHFISESLKILSKSNTKDQNIILIKDNLSFFLEKYSKTFASTNREATKNGYRKALLTYFILFISKVVNGS